MAKIVVFGLQDFASLAHFYLKYDTQHEVVAFSVTRDYLPSAPVFEGLPVVGFEGVESVFPPSDYEFFAPISHLDMNRFRQEIYNQAKEKGYRLISYISSKATVFPHTGFGENCFVLEDNTIQPYSQVGNNVVLWSGNHIGHHSIIRDHVLFTSHVVLSGQCVVDAFCFLGANSTVRDRVHLGEGTLVAMSACITHDTEPWSVYSGVPGTRGTVPSSELDF